MTTDIYEALLVTQEAARLWAECLEEHGRAGEVAPIDTANETVSEFIAALHRAGIPGVDSAT